METTKFDVDLSFVNRAFDATLIMLANLNLD